MAHRLLSSVRFWVWLLVAVVACGEAPPPPVAHPVGEGALGDPVSIGGTVSPLAGIGHMDRLPADTELVVVAPNPRGLIAMIGYDEIRSRFAALFEPAAAESREELGEDFTTVEAMEKIGIDTSAPLGFAWLHSEAEAGCVFGGLRDADAFRSWIRRAAAMQKMEIEETAQGDAQVIRPSGDDEAALILRQNQFMVVIVDRDRYAAGIIGRLSRLSPEDSLAASPSFRRLAAQPLAMGDITGYIGVQAVTTHLFEETRGGQIPIVADVQAAVFGMSIGQSNRLAFDAVLDVKDGSFLATAGVDGPTPYVFRARIDEPAIVVGGHLAQNQVGALFDELLRIDGRPEKDRREIEEELGLDLHRQVAKALSGELGLVYRYDESVKDVWDRDRLTLAAELEDDGGKGLVEALKRAIKGDEPMVEHLGEYLVLGDDKATIANLKRPEADGRLPKGVVFDEFFAPGAIVLLRVDASLLGPELFGVHDVSMAMAMPPAPPAVGSVSPKVTELRRKIDALNEKIETSTHEASKMESEVGRGALRRAGTLLVRLTREGEVLRIRGVQALQAPSLASILERAIDDFTKNEGKLAKISAEMEKLITERVELERQLTETLAKP